MEAIGWKVYPNCVVTAKTQNTNYNAQQGAHMIPIYFILTLDDYNCYLYCLALEKRTILTIF